MVAAAGLLAPRPHQPAGGLQLGEPALDATPGAGCQIFVRASVGWSLAFSGTNEPISSCMRSIVGGSRRNQSRWSTHQSRKAGCVTYRRLFGKAWRRVSKGFSIQVKPRRTWDYGGIRRSLCFQKQQRPGGTNGAAYISTGRQCARCDQMNWRNLPVDGVEGRSADVKGEEQAEADQGQRAERVNPPAAAAACSGGPAGAGGGNTGGHRKPHAPSPRTDVWPVAGRAHRTLAHQDAEFRK